MNKRIVIPVLLAFGAFFSTHSYSQGTNTERKPGPPVELSITSFSPLGVKGGLTVAGSADSTALPGTQRAPAPSLTRIAVYAVGSSDCGWEYMTSIGQFSTTCNHGGSLLRAAVQEIGYGNNPIAWMTGGILPSSTNYLTESICIVGSSYTSPCPAGYTVVGWMKYYNLDGNQNGLFEFQDTSTNSPWNTMYTRINIQ